MQQVSYVAQDEVKIDDKSAEGSFWKKFGE